MKKIIVRIIASVCFFSLVLFGMILCKPSLFNFVFVRKVSISQREYRAKERDFNFLNLKMRSLGFNKKETNELIFPLKSFLDKGGEIVLLQKDSLNGFFVTELEYREENILSKKGKYGNSYFNIVKQDLNSGIEAMSAIIVDVNTQGVRDRVIKEIKGLGFDEKFQKDIETIALELLAKNINIRSVIEKENYWNQSLYISLSYNGYNNLVVKITNFEPNDYGAKNVSNILSSILWMKNSILEGKDKISENK